MPNYKTKRISTKEYLLTSSFTTTSTSYVIVTAMTLTLKTNKGKTIILANLPCDNDTGTAITSCALHDDASQIEGAQIILSSVANHEQACPLTAVLTNDGSAIAVYMKVASNTGRVYYLDTTSEPKLTAIEL